MKKPKIELFAFKLAFNDGETTSLQEENTAILFGVHEQLQEQNLKLQTIRSNTCQVDSLTGDFTFSCPKLPKDTDARIGVRKDPQNPQKKQKIFGYNAILTTSVELELNIELPVAVTNIPGNAEEGKQLIVNKEQVQKVQGIKAEVDLADAKYDTKENYEYIRATGSIPIIDYNPRNEKLNKQALLDRGFDQNGWPFAPCGLLTRPNGFDPDRQRLAFCCFKQCLNLNNAAIKGLKENYNVDGCPYFKNKTGYNAHMSMEEHPRLVNEIPRGSKRYQDIKKLRSAAERSNATLKEDLGILVNPRVMAIERANILVQLSTIVLLLVKALRFIVQTTLEYRGKQKSKSEQQNKTKSPKPPESFRNMVQLE